MRTLDRVEVVTERDVGREGGFLFIKRLTLRNFYADGTASADYLVDYVDRPRGLDAVAVLLWRRDARGAPEVLIRGQLRPSVQLARARAPERLAVPDGDLPQFHREIVAGLVEHNDSGEAGLRRRAADEVHEEAGYKVSPDELVSLGAASFPAAGVIPERHFYFAVDVGTRAQDTPGHGDGSPLEDAHEIRWLPLDQAIRACVEGSITDSKTEIALRRLSERLGPTGR